MIRRRGGCRRRAGRSIAALPASGWAIDPDSTASVPVVIYIDGPGGGVVAGVFNADLSRPDLASAYPQAGPNHGFDRNG